MKEESTKEEGRAALPLARLDWALIALLAAAAIIARAAPGPRTIDDAYITFRYARNIAEGVGFVYNPGQHILGTSTPLFALVMAALGFLTGRSDYPTWAVIANALADAATCALLYLLARRFLGNRAPALALGLLWAVAPFSVTVAVGGMETSVFILWMMATFWLYVSGRDRWAGLTAALGVLTRPDGLVWAGLVLLHQLWARFRARGHRPLRDWLPWRTWLVFALALLPWVIFALAYFGTPLPRSAGAKIVTYTLPPNATLIRLIQHVATPFFEYDAIGPAGTAIGLVLYPALFLMGAVRVLRGARDGGRGLPMLAYPWVYGAIFALSNVLLFRWYLAPPLPPYFLGIVCGMWALASAVAGVGMRRRGEAPETASATARAGTVRNLAFGAAAALWLALSLNAWALHPDHGPDRPAPEMAFIRLELLYERVGRLLADEYGVTADTVVSAGDIGAVGYFSRATIFDTVGLVTPAATAYYPVDPDIVAPGNNYAIPPRLILDAQPEFLVIVESYGRLGLMQDRDFNAQYKQIVKLGTDIYDSRGMLVFRRSS